MRDLARDSAPRTGEADLHRLLRSLTSGGPAADGSPGRLLRGHRAERWPSTSTSPETLPVYGAERPGTPSLAPGTRAPVGPPAGDDRRPWPWPESLARASRPQGHSGDPAVDDGRPRVPVHLVLSLGSGPPATQRSPTSASVGPRCLDLMVTALPHRHPPGRRRPARPPSSLSAGAVQRGDPRLHPTAVLAGPVTGPHPAAVTEQLQGRRATSGSTSPLEARPGGWRGRARPGRPQALVAQGRRLGARPMVEYSRREPDPDRSERRSSA